MYESPKVRYVHNCNVPLQGKSRRNPPEKCLDSSRILDDYIWRFRSVWLWRRGLPEGILFHILPESYQGPGVVCWELSTTGSQLCSRQAGRSYCARDRNRGGHSKFWLRVSVLTSWIVSFHDGSWRFWTLSDGRWHSKSSRETPCQSGSYMHFIYTMNSKIEISCCKPCLQSWYVIVVKKHVYIESLLCL